jgi:hypothetical protein
MHPSAAVPAQALSATPSSAMRQLYDVAWMGSGRTKRVERMIVRNRILASFQKAWYLKARNRPKKKM